MSLENYRVPPPPAARKILVPYDAWKEVVSAVQAFRALRVVGGRFVTAGKSAVLEIADPSDPSETGMPETPMESEPSAHVGRPVSVCGMIEKPVPKTYVLDICVARALSVTSFSARCASGGCMVTLGGQALAVASAALASHAFSSPVAVAAGETLSLSISSPASPSDLSFVVEAIEEAP